MQPQSASTRPLVLIQLARERRQGWKDWARRQLGHWCLHWQPLPPPTPTSGMQKRFRVCIWVSFETSRTLTRTLTTVLFDGTCAAALHGCEVEYRLDSAVPSALTQVPRSQVPLLGARPLSTQSSHRQPPRHFSDYFCNLHCSSPGQKLSTSTTPSAALMAILTAMASSPPTKQPEAVADKVLKRAEVGKVRSLFSSLLFPPSLALESLTAADRGLLLSLADGPIPPKPPRTSTLQSETGLARPVPRHYRAQVRRRAETTQGRPTTQAPCRRRNPIRFLLQCIRPPIPYKGSDELPSQGPFVFRRHWLQQRKYWAPQKNIYGKL